MAEQLTITFLNAYQNTSVRGAEVFVNELSKRLGSRNSVHIIAGKVKDYKRWPIIWRLYLDSNAISVFWFTVKSLPALIETKPDIVIPVNGGWQPAILRIVTWVMGKKLIISGQAGIGWDDRNNLWCFPDAFVATTKWASKWAKNANPLIRSRVHHIPNGVDLRLFRPLGPKYKRGLKRPLVLAVGALIPTKGMDLVIKAVAAIPEAHLLIAGKGPEKAALIRLADSEMPGRFEFISVDHTLIPSVYRLADVFTLPTWPNESFGIVFVEALACNVPVIAWDNPQRREIIGEAGIFVKNPEDTLSYTNAISQALKKKWKDAPRKQAEAYSWDEIADNYEMLFSKLVTK